MQLYAKSIKTLAIVAALTAFTAHAETSVTCDNQSGFIQKVYADGVLCSDYGFINEVSVSASEKSRVAITMKYLDKNSKLLFTNRLSMPDKDFTFFTMRDYTAIPTNDVNINFEDYVDAKANPNLARALAKTHKRYEEGLTVFAQVKILPNKDINLNIAMNELKMAGTAISTTQWRENKVLAQNKPYTFTVNGNTMEITVTATTVK